MTPTPINLKQRRFLSKLLLCFFYFNYITLYAQYTTVGDAVSTGTDCVQLTPAVTSQVGCAYWGVQVDFNQSFTQEFTMNFGVSTGFLGGADGITIIYEPNGGMPCGGGGENIGFNGISDSWVVEFDTYDNGGATELGDDHVAIAVNGSRFNIVSGPLSLGEIEDDLDHDVEIAWDACTMTFTIFFDGIEVISVVNDVVANYFGGQNIVNWGHSSSTGGAVNVHTVCLDNFQQTSTTNPSIIIEGPFTICKDDSYEIDGNFETDPGEYLDETILCVSETYVQLNVLDIVVQPALAIDCNAEFPCLNISVTGFVTNYDLTIDNNVTYLWTTVDGVIQSGEDTPIPTVCTPGSYEVAVTANGVTCTDEIIVLDNGAMPDQPVFSGDTLMCIGSSGVFFGTYTVPIQGGIVDYFWTVPDGAAAVNGENTLPTIDVEFTTAEAGEVCLFVTNQCNLTNSYCLPISVQEEPVTPEILGNLAVCEGVENYIATNWPEGISTEVTWVVPVDATILGNPFSENIDVDWTGSNGGDICVFYDNDCGSTSECFAVTITTNAISPTINGLFSICPTGATTQNYNTTVADSDVIHWSTTNGAITSADDVGQVTIDWSGVTTGEICLEVTTDCGSAETCEIISFIAPQTCDDGNCNNGIESWNESICECETTPAVLGCTNINAVNYNSMATCEDGSCILDCIELGPPIDVCGFEYVLQGVTPTTGTWTNLCVLSDGVAAFPETMDDTFLFEVEACGTYYFEYSIDDATCKDKDTLIVNFENSNVGVINIVPIIEIEYEHLECHEGGVGGTGCDDGNIIVLDPVNPLDVLWNLCVGGQCNSANVETQTFGENGCEADAIDIFTDSNSGIVPVVCATFSQDDFVENGVIDVDEFLDLLDFDLAISLLQFQCPLEVPCFDVPDTCTIIETQNFTIDIPIQGKGFWTYNNQQLTDVAMINVAGQDYQLTTDLNACYYGPEPLTFTLLEIVDGVPSDLISDVTINLQWQENWTIETITVPVEVPVTNPNCDLCNTGYNIVINPIAAPIQPDFDCQSIELFFNVPIPLNCDDNDCTTADMYDTDNCICVNTPIAEPSCDDDNCNTADNYNTQTCLCENIPIPPFVCDDLNCTNGIEVWNPVTCNCDVLPTILGCTNSASCNFDPTATCDDSSCIYEIICDDGICINGVESWDMVNCECMTGIPPTPCTDDADCLNGFEIWDADACICNVVSSVPGCTDPASPNYDPLADCDYGSCGCDVLDIPTGIQPIVYCLDDIVPPFLADNPGDGFEIVWMDASGMELGTGILFSPPFNGIYTVVVRNIATGCTSDVVSTSVSEVASPLTLILQDTATLDCISATYMVDGSGSSLGSNYEYLWEGPDTEAFENNPTILISLAGTYTLTVLDLVNGCSTSDNIVIVENVDFPELILSEVENLDCDTDEVVLSGAGSQQSTFISNYWIAPNGVDIISFDVNAIVTQPGMYTFFGFDSSNNCLNDMTLEVIGDFVAPLADAGPDIFLDCDQSLQPIGSENTTIGNAITFDWSTNNSDVVLPLNPPLILDVNTPGAYTLTVSDDSNGCFSADIVNVFEGENNIELTDLTVIDPDCYGETGAIFLNEPIGGTPPYLYSIDGLPFSASATFLDLASGSYEVAILDADGCQFETEVVIDSPSQLTLELGGNIFVNLGDSVVLTALTNNTIDSIIWVSVDTLSCDSCLITGLTPQLTTTIQATVYDENGCIETDVINIIVNKERNIFIANTFTPNGDGLNDILNIFGGQDVAVINSFQIFDRWGEQVFQLNNFLPNNPNLGWDGTLNGKPMNPAVFVYYAEITFVDGAREIFSGDVALVR